MKNSLLFPKTKPYPFTGRFIYWISLAIFTSILLSSCNGELRNAKDNAHYNPFSIENAGVPYSLSCTGLPERLHPEDALKVIQQAFADSGIKLQEDVWLEDSEVGVKITGYSRDEKIGFLFLDRTNMDETFIKSGRPPYERERVKLNKKPLDIIYELTIAERARNASFELLLKERKKFFNSFLYRPTKSKYQLAKACTNIESEEKNRSIFHQVTIKHSIDSRVKNAVNKDSLVGEVILYIGSRLVDGPEKMILMNCSQYFDQSLYQTAEMKAQINNSFTKLKAEKSNKKFVEKYILFFRFLQHDTDRYRYEIGKYKYGIANDVKYEKLKQKIMDENPIEEWFDHIDKLEDYCNKKMASFDEVKQINNNNNNNNGTQFIAPISIKDNKLILHIDYRRSKLRANIFHYRHTLTYKKAKRRNGLIYELGNLESNEQQKIREKYNAIKLEKLHNEFSTFEEIESLDNLIAKEHEKISEKYAIIRQSRKSEHEKFKAKGEWLYDVEERPLIRRYKKAAKKAKIKTIHNLEAEVKMYIKWARSQMGN